MGKTNCWEFKQCGREPGGAKVDEFGICDAATNQDANGLNNGINGGRVCFAIAGTLCGGQVQGVFASKVQNCIDCDFFKSIVNDEGSKIEKLSTIMRKLKDYHIYRDAENQ